MVVKNRRHRIDKALTWLEQIDAEENKITIGFKEIGVPVLSAFDSQALLELKKEYCDAKRCLDCAVGNYLLGDRSDCLRLTDIDSNSNIGQTRTVRPGP